MHKPNQKRGLVPFCIFPSRSLKQVMNPRRIPRTAMRPSLPRTAEPRWQHEHYWGFIHTWFCWAPGHHQNTLMWCWVKVQVWMRSGLLCCLSWKSITLNCQQCHAYKCLILSLHLCLFRLSLNELYHLPVQITANNFVLLPFTLLKYLFLYCKFMFQILQKLDVHGTGHSSMIFWLLSAISLPLACFNILIFFMISSSLPATEDCFANRNPFLPTPFAGSYTDAEPSSCSHQGECSSPLPLPIRIGFCCFLLVVLVCWGCFLFFVRFFLFCQYKIRLIHRSIKKHTDTECLTQKPNSLVVLFYPWHLFTCFIVLL